jgi:hypothetical protein
MTDRSGLLEDASPSHGALDDHDAAAVRSPSAARAVNRDDDEEEGAPRDNCPQCYNARIDRFFKISERKSTVWTEVSHLSHITVPRSLLLLLTNCCI